MSCCIKLLKALHQERKRNKILKRIIGVLGIVILLLLFI